MLGIVTVTYNSAPVLQSFLASIFEQTYYDYKLYVIDNASNDETLKILAEVNDCRIQIISNKENLGVAEGNNQGIRAALLDRANAILLINNDTEFDEGTLEKLLTIFESNPIEALAPKVMYFEPKDKAWFAGGEFIPWRAYLNTHVVKSINKQNQTDAGLEPIQYAPTCFMLIGAQVFQKLGLMDPSYFVYTDDCDYCWRMYKAGIQLWYTEKVWIYHKASSLTGGMESQFALRYMTRNRLLFVRKHFGFFTVLWSMVYIQAEIWYKYIFISKKLYTLKVQQKAFFEGWRV